MYASPLRLIQNSSLLRMTPSLLLPIVKLAFKYISTFPHE